jgi:hypothetical protein
MSDIVCKTTVLKSGEWTITRTMRLYEECACSYCEVIANNGHVLSCVTGNGAPRGDLPSALERFIKQPQLPPMDCSGELLVLGYR